jgi:hypothetical protein
MKVSVSLPGDDIQFLDDYAREQGLESRSAAVHRAISSSERRYSARHTRPRGSSGRLPEKPIAGTRPPRMASDPDATGRNSRVDLEPARGSEANKRRPAVIVSNDAANATATRLGRGVITVVPITSNVQRVYPFPIWIERGPSTKRRGRGSTARRTPGVREFDGDRASDGVTPRAGPVRLARRTGRRAE